MFNKQQKENDLLSVVLSLDSSFPYCSHFTFDLVRNEHEISNCKLGKKIRKPEVTYIYFTFGV